MADKFKVDLSLDLRGLACPLPVVRVGKSIKDVPVGGIVEASPRTREPWRTFLPGLRLPGMRSSRRSVTAQTSNSTLKR